MREKDKVNFCDYFSLDASGSSGHRNDKQKKKDGARNNFDGLFSD